MSSDAEIAVIGATGFLGTAISTDLDRRGFPPRRLSQSLPSDSERLDIRGDVEQITSLIDGSRVVVHAASYVGADRDVSRDTNVHGSRNLARACSIVGVDKLIYLSTTAVYGFGPHLKTAPWAHSRPASWLSHDRHHAEQHVLEHGGTVLRTHLLYGVGDRWLLGPLAGFLSRAGAVPDDAFQSSASLMDVADLGRLVGGLALSPEQETGPRVWNAVPETPVSTVELCRMALHACGLDRLPARPSTQLRTIAARMGMTEHQYDFALGNRTYDAEEIWAIAHEVPPGKPSLMPHHKEWYRRWRDQRSGVGPLEDDGRSVRDFGELCLPEGQDFLFGTNGALAPRAGH